MNLYTKGKFDAQFLISEGANPWILLLKLDGPRCYQVGFRRYCLQYIRKH